MKTEYNSRGNIFTNEYELLDGYKKRLDQLSRKQLHQKYGKKGWKLF